MGYDTTPPHKPAVFCPSGGVAPVRGEVALDPAAGPSLLRAGVSA